MQLGMLQHAKEDWKLAGETFGKAVKRTQEKHGMKSPQLVKPLWLLAQTLINSKRDLQVAQKHLTRILILLKGKEEIEFEARVTHQLAIVSLQQQMPNQCTYYLKAALRLLDSADPKKVANIDPSLRENIVQDLEKAGEVVAVPSTSKKPATTASKKH